VQQFELALADPLYTTPVQANLNAGLCLMKKPAPVMAEPYFREVLKLDPKRGEALYQMAKISYDSGKTYSARGFIQRFFEVADDSPESLLLAVRIEGKLRAKDAEASYALRLRGKFPDSPEVQELRKLSATN
jgi:type IV pilus assembly protein PilF